MATDPPIRLDAASTLAVIVSSAAPLLFLDGQLHLVAASASFCEAFDIDPASVTGRPLGLLGAGEWGSRQLASLLKATASGAAAIKAYEFDLVRHGLQPRRLVLNAHRLQYDEEQPVRLLLAMVDVTEARAAEKRQAELLREKANLLQEVQHRVANSLQIIASVLLQSARKVQSDEGRGHLHDAHHRVLSIAAVQRQLATSGLNQVALRPYLVQLCESLGASMIQDHALLSIEVNVDESLTTADTSVSLGLIVTELVINALKHAFPEQRSGKIIVAYHSSSRRWTLSVTDNGVGMSTGTTVPKPGLGTGIVQALVGQLHAELKVTDAAPGTAVSIEQLPTLAVIKPHEIAAA